MTVKQVICIRRDLKMRRGKECAQSAHASNQVLEEIAFQGKEPTNEFLEWLNTGKTKVCVRVDSEQELDDIYANAINAGLDVHLVIDSGRTEFNGVPTKTCLAIGPDDADIIDKITGHLQLY